MTEAPPTTEAPTDAASVAAELRGEPDWFRDAVFYQVVLPSFADGNKDGTGDFSGLADKLGYLSWLGVDGVWVPPFYPSPLGDGGYDVADYRDVAPRYGTLGDFDRFVEEAHRQGIKVIIDIVMNHTSSAHPWFEASRTDPDGPYGDYYVWSDTDEAYPDVRIIFVDTEESNWAWDDVRGQYYWHRFFSHQPDLNFENDRVQQEMLDIVRFWCERGVDGLRLDAIPYLYEEEGTNGENLPATHHFVAKVRRMLDEEYPGVLLVAEANQPPDQVVEYFGSDEAPECHMCFHFPLMPQIFKSIKTEETSGLASVWEDTPVPPAGGIWGLFLRNHDELTLEMVTDDERWQMYQWYAPEPRMRANVGIRRRLFPLLDADRPSLELVYGLLLSLPGAPFLYYGDEIGMGDTIELADRDGVRTPMQWDGTEGAGFSEADPETFYLPLVDREGYAQDEVSVSAQESDPDSWLNWVRSLLAARKAARSLQDGHFEIVQTGNPAVFAFWRWGSWRAAGDNASVLCVFNFSSEPQEAVLSLGETSPDTAVRWIVGNAQVEHARGEWRAEAPARGFAWLELD